MTEFKATLIISIYRNLETLRLILYALKLQTNQQFEIIISEDGECEDVSSYIKTIRADFQNLSHLTQEDVNFRKNRALNRAVSLSKSDYLIFIDGDCIPHSRFIEHHIGCAEIGRVCVGRRAELGSRLSQLLTQHHWLLKLLSNRLFYVFVSLLSLFDRAKNMEAGLYSSFLHGRIKNKYLGLFGCNFSCYKNDLLKINGFNEEFIEPGIGEDSDLEWRFSRVGVYIKSVKFLAVQYHIHHQHKFYSTETNIAIMNKSKQEDAYYCVKGIDQHL